MKWLYNKTFPLYFAITLIGVSSITAQILFLRELVVIFYGNELIYGIILSTWLLTYSAGSGILGRFADKIQKPKTTFTLTQFLIIILLPALIFITRNAKNLLGIPLGALLDLSTIILITFSMLFPLTLILGFQFALGSKLLAEELGKDAREIGKVYMLEAAGAVIGGLLLSLILLLFLNPFQIAALLTVLLAISGLILTRNYKLIVLPIIAVTLLIASSYLDQTSNKLSWKGYNLVKSIDSPYGKLAIIKDRNEYNFFMNGSLLFSTADKAGAEELIHLSFLQHKNPKNILLIGGGLGGALNEILKYPVQKVDYVELDPKVIKLAEEFIPQRFPPQARIYTIDGVRFIRQTKKKYDLILINLPDPQSALINRYYTLEFLSKCKDKLSENGILVFKLSTSTAYLGAEMRALNASILKTSFSTFKYVTLIPGNYNYFFACNHKLNTDRSFLLSRWQKRKLKTEYFNAPALSYDLSPERIKYIWEAIRFDQKTKINTDLQPHSYYQTLLLWTSLFHSPLKYFFGSMMNLKFGQIFIIFLVIVLIIKAFSQKRRNILLPSIIAFLGFAGMTAQVVIILVFQAQYGYVYQMIGLLTAAFMAGLALGSFLINWHYEKIKSPLTLIRIFLVFLLIYLLGLLDVLVYQPVSSYNILRFLSSIITLPLLPFSSFVIGGLIGAIFPLAVKIQQQFKKEIGGLAGTLYGVDLLGSSFAAILVSIFFVPIYGIIGTILIALELIALCVLVSLWL